MPDGDGHPWPPPDARASGFASPWLARAKKPSWLFGRTVRRWCVEQWFESGAKLEALARFVAFLIFVF